MLAALEDVKIAPGITNPSLEIHPGHRWAFLPDNPLGGSAVGNRKQCDVLVDDSTSVGQEPPTYGPIECFSFKLFYSLLWVLCNVHCDSRHANPS